MRNGRSLDPHLAKFAHEEARFITLCASRSPPCFYSGFRTLASSGTNLMLCHASFHKCRDPIHGRPAYCHAALLLTINLPISVLHNHVFGQQPQPVLLRLWRGLPSYIRQFCQLQCVYRTQWLSSTSHAISAAVAASHSTSAVVVCKQLIHQPAELANVVGRPPCPPSRVYEPSRQPHSVKSGSYTGAIPNQFVRLPDPSPVHATSARLDQRTARSAQAGSRRALREPQTTTSLLLYPSDGI